MYNLHTEYYMSACQRDRSMEDLSKYNQAKPEHSKARLPSLIVLIISHTIFKIVTPCTDPEIIKGMEGREKKKVGKTTLFSNF